MQNLNITLLRKSVKQTQMEFAKNIGIAQSYLSEIERGIKPITNDVYNNLLSVFGEDNLNKFTIPNCDIIAKKEIKIETRPRIPLNAAAGTLAVALSGVSAEDCEELPFIQAFSNYNYTILVKGDSMEPEFHSGDELACLQLTNGKANFIQWGRYHVLDTAQGVLVKRIYDKGDYILCKSDNSDLYEDFKIHKEEIYNLGLIIGMLRRY
jgi:phage repressor protein C with HTH and peptisase S24 domain|nr:MAG TPA: hypothetical protein [Caudoviricetes sp.]